MELQLLLSPEQVAQRLGICRQHFYKILPDLRARGLRRKQIGRRWKYMAEDLPKVAAKLPGDGDEAQDNS